MFPDLRRWDINKTLLNSLIQPLNMICFANENETEKAINRKLKKTNL